MDGSDLLKSAPGAIIGFVLAQIVNFAKIGFDWFMRPRLSIDITGLPNCRFLSHSEEVGGGESLSEEMYAFYVRNLGRRVASGVRFQITKIETRDSSQPTFRKCAQNAMALAVYNGASRTDGSREIVLVPKAAAIVCLGWWREDSNVVMPAVDELPHYYQETCSGAAEYRFTVVAFDDAGRFAKAMLRVSA